jgi:hypothetical protein
VGRGAIGGVAKDHLRRAVPGRGAAGGEGEAGGGGGAGPAEVGELGDCAGGVKEEVVGLNIPGGHEGQQTRGFPRSLGEWKSHGGRAATMYIARCQLAVTLEQGRNKSDAICTTRQYVCVQQLSENK